MPQGINCIRFKPSKINSMQTSNNQNMNNLKHAKKWQSGSQKSKMQSNKTNNRQINFGLVLIYALNLTFPFQVGRFSETYLMLSLSFIVIQFERQRMNSNERTIQYQDTSFKKYPYNKYYDYKELKHVSRRVFEDKPQSQTLDTHALRKKSKRTKSKQPRPSRKSVQTAKTLSSSRLKSKPQRINMSITLENCKDFSKNEIAEQLHHYTKLCLNLRKENQSLQEKLQQNKRTNKENLVELQRKINKLNERALEIRQKELTFEESRLQQGKHHKGNKENLLNKAKPKPVTKDSEFKRFFLHFIDNFGRVDEKLQRKMTTQKSMQHKLMMGQRAMRESCEFLRQKKYKFNCIFD